MVKPKSVIILGGIVFLGILSYLFLFPSEAKRVRKSFDLLSRTTTKEPGEALITSANRAQNIGRLFDETCEFKLEGDPFYSFSGTYSREEASGYSLRMRAYFSALSLKFHDLRVDFPERGTARVNLTARLTGKSTSGETVEEVRELLCLLKKTGKD